jgi:hypothetical protein
VLATARASVPILPMAAVLIAGAFLRLANLSSSVAAVDLSWRARSYHAATEGPARMYGPTGHTVSLGDIEVPVVYPPLALYELALIGRVHLARSDGRFPNDVRLTRTIKGAIVLLDAALTSIIFAIVRRAAGLRRALWAGAAYWLNPAVLMATTLGYVDVATLAGYYGVLGRLPAGPDGLVGRTGLRGLTTILAADSRVADAWWIAGSAFVLAGIVWLARRDPQRPLAAGGLAITSLFCLWSLFAFYHNTNNLIMMLPAFVFVWLVDDRPGSPQRWVPILLLQAALMFDVPTRLGPRIPPDHWAAPAVEHCDRALVVATLVYVALRWCRLTLRTDEGPRTKDQGLRV